MERGTILFYSAASNTLAHRGLDGVNVIELSPVVRAELSGEDTCTATASGITARSVIALCRTLLDAGHDPNTRLNVYRGNVLALKVRSIGEAARLTVGSGGVGFKHAREADTAGLVRLNDEAATLPAGANRDMLGSAIAKLSGTPWR
jgi:hypothetical protein